jgi:hypothetical protein
VEGITRETFVPKSLILPQDISALCDDPGLRTAILATLPTFDDSGVAVCQTGGQDPSTGSGFLVHRLGVPSPSVWLPVPIPPWPPTPWTREKGLQAVPPPQVGPGGRRRRGDAGCVALMGRSFRSPPRSARRLQMGPRRPTPRATTHRGTSVPRYRRHHHHPRVITSRSTSTSNSNSSRRGSSSDLSSSSHNSNSHS